MTETGKIYVVYAYSGSYDKYSSKAVISFFKKSDASEYAQMAQKWNDDTLNSWLMKNKKDNPYGSRESFGGTGRSYDEDKNYRVHELTVYKEIPDVFYRREN